MPRRSATQQYKDFTGAGSVQKINFKIPNFPKEWIFVGFTDEISYLSDKWYLDGKKRGYRHKLKKQGILLKSPDGKIFLTVGVKINMQKRGLTG